MKNKCAVRQMLVGGASAVIASTFMVVNPQVTLLAAETEADKPVPLSEVGVPANTGGTIVRDDGKVAETKPQSATGTVSQKFKPSYFGRLRIQYDYREQGDAEDADLYGYLYANLRNLGAGHVDAYMSGRMKKDLDGNKSSSQADNPYGSVDESRGASENRILQLYGDIHNQSRTLSLRGGRQYVEISDYLHLDGAQLQVKENGMFGGRIYAGRPVSYYTSISDDYAGGVSIVGRPWEGNRSRLTLARYHDGEDDQDDQNYYLDVRQNLSEVSRARGQVSILNEEFRMGRMDWYFSAPDGSTDLSIGGSYWGSFDAKTRAYSPLYNVLGEQNPYAYTYIRLTQQIVPKWMVSPAVSLRFTDSDGGEDNSSSNRDYENYELALIYEPSRAFSASVALEYWSVEKSDSFLGVSGDLRYRYDRAWELSVGASFAEYTYDSYSDISYSAGGGQATISESGTVIEESPFVRTYFIRGKWNVTKNLALRGQFDIEDDDSEDDLAYRVRGSVEVRI